MSFSLKLTDGDLVALGDQLDLVFGKEKLIQDVDCWLRERYGGDRFHLSMGSILQEFIGGVASGSTQAEVHAEVLRVLQNYQAVQLRILRENPTLLSTSEMLVSIDNIIVQVNYDTVQVACKLRNGSGNTATISVSSTL